MSLSVESSVVGVETLGESLDGAVEDDVGCVVVVGRRRDSGGSVKSWKLDVLPSQS